MDDALLVRRVERIGDLDAGVEQAVEHHRRARDHAVERCALELLHADEPLTIGFVDLVNGADIRMIERRSRTGFALETFEGSGIPRQLRRKKFESDAAAELEVL